MVSYNNFLKDTAFLHKISRYRVKEYYAQIQLLNFQTEKVLCEFTGKVIGGNMNVAANSPTRRTGSLQVLFDEQTNDLTNIRNLISIDKKMSLSIGIKNPFYNINEYRDYGEILWFKQGVFFITGASASIQVNGQSVNMNFIDKMGKLNGVCGGTIPAATSFHEQIVFHPNGEDYDTNEILIRDIIFEAVHHFGEEEPSRIVIDDVDRVGYKVVEYLGTNPIRFHRNENAVDRRFLGYSYVISDKPVPGYDQVYTKGNPIGYMETNLTYPGELILPAGSTVTQLLDTIVQALGNYEYFYDVDGVFHFQRIKNYLMTGHTPLNYKSDDENEINFQNLYLPIFSNYISLNEFSDAELVQSASFSPKYDNIKNDFICWGTLNSNDKVKTMVRYHLAIDERPKDIPLAPDTENTCSLCHKTIYVVKNAETGEVIRYQTNLYVIDDTLEKVEKYASSLDDIFGVVDKSAMFNWREELYRRALLAYGTSTEGSYYDEELLAEWRKLYNPDSQEYKAQWEALYGKTWQGYIPDVQYAPKNLDYWLDIIDSTASIGKFSVKKIGRRTKVVMNSNINQVFPTDVPAIYFIENKGNFEEANLKVQEYISEGRECSLINSETLSYFSYLDSFGSCYETVREMLYYNLNFNASIQLQTIPLFHLDVNRIIRVNLSDLHIHGDYIINTISWQIGNYSAMSIQANEAITIN